MPEERRPEAGAQDSSGNPMDRESSRLERETETETSLEDEEKRSKPGHPEYLENFRGD